MDADLNAILDEVYSAINAHDASRLAETYAEDLVIEMAGHVAVQGKAAGRAGAESSLAAFPDMVQTPIRRMIQGNIAYEEYIFEGTNTGSLSRPEGKIPPTNRHVKYQAARYYEFRDGKMARLVWYYDSKDYEQQLGLTE